MAIVLVLPLLLLGMLLASVLVFLLLLLGVPLVLTLVLPLLLLSVLLPIWFGLLVLTLFPGDNPLFRPAARAVHKQEQRFREAMTEGLRW